MSNETPKIAKPAFPVIKPEMLDRLNEQAERLAAEMPRQEKSTLSRLFHQAA